jgi:hypothetical protein
MVAIPMADETLRISARYAYLRGRRTEPGDALFRQGCIKYAFASCNNEQLSRQIIGAHTKLFRESL